MKVPSRLNPAFEHGLVYFSRPGDRILELYAVYVTKAYQACGR